MITHYPGNMDCGEKVTGRKTTRGSPAQGQTLSGHGSRHNFEMHMKFGTKINKQTKHNKYILQVSMCSRRGIYIYEKIYFIDVHRVS